MTAGSCRPYEAGPSGYELYWLLVSMGLRAAREVEAREAELRAAEAWLSARGWPRAARGGVARRTISLLARKNFTTHRAHSRLSVDPKCLIVGSGDTQATRYLWNRSTFTS